MQEPSNTKHFKSKYFYVTLESTTGIKVSITAQNPQDEESQRKKRMQEKKKQAKQAGAPVVTVQKTVGVPHSFTQLPLQEKEIQRALQDRQFRGVLIDRADSALQRQKNQSKAAANKSMVETAQVIDGEIAYVMQEKDIMKINKDMVQNYINTVQASMIHRMNQREYNFHLARQRKLNDELITRDYQLRELERWDQFRLERKRAIERYIE